MTKPHATNPRAVREAKHRHAKLVRAERQQERRAPKAPGGGVIDEATLARALDGLSYDYDGHRVYVCLLQPDSSGAPFTTAEFGYWLRAARALLERL